MKEEELKRLVTGGESETLELKPSLSDVDRIVEVACSFANQSGGHIVIGVGKDGTPIGVTVGRQTIEQLVNRIIDHTEPPIYPNVEVVDVGGKNVIVVSVRESEDKTHTAFGKPWIRIGSVTKQMKKTEYDERILQKRVPFDKQIHPDATLADIDRRKVSWYLRQRERIRKVKKPKQMSLEDLLVNLEVAQRTNSKMKLTNAAMLFFGKRPQKGLIQSSLRLVRFRGTEIINPTIDSLECSGAIWEMVDQAEDFVRRNIRLLGARTEESFRREEKFEYPIKAVREAIINALIHRDYYEPADTRVFIFDDRIEIINPGTFPKGISPERPTHRPVNPLLCKLMFDVGFIEKYGSGIYMMRELCREWKIKELRYEIHPIETKVIFESPVKIPTVVEAKEVPIWKELNERQIKAISYARERGSITRDEYTRINRISHTIAHLELKALVKKGFLIRKGKGRATKYLIKG